MCCKLSISRVFEALCMGDESSSPVQDSWTTVQQIHVLTGCLHQPPCWQVTHQRFPCLSKVYHLKKNKSLNNLQSVSTVSSPLCLQNQLQPLIQGDDLLKYGDESCKTLMLSTKQCNFQTSRWLHYGKE